ncbi:MAG: hypothetical protein ACXWLX_09630 [Rhizomicrobium sp.]
MSGPRFFPILLLALSLHAAGSGTALAAAIQDPGMAVLPDPDLSKAARFPASAATAGVAHTGPALDDVDIHARGCSPRNPCALPTPAGPDDAAAQPARQQLGKNRRGRQAG